MGGLGLEIPDGAHFILSALTSFETGGARISIPSNLSRAVVEGLDRRTLRNADVVARARLKLRMRHALLSSIHPDPLRTSSVAQVLEPLRVFIPMHEKDSWGAHLAVASLTQNFSHPLRSISLCLPNLQAVPRWASSYAVEIVRDSEVLSSLGPGGSRFASLPGRHLQQVLKLAFSLLPGEATLVHDADTVLLRPRVWLSEGHQILPLRLKPPRHFGISTAQFIGEPGALKHSSSVTHHQLVQQGVLRSAFGDVRSAGDRLWTFLGMPDIGPAPSEYQLYGSLLRLFSQRWSPAGWSHANGKITRADTHGLATLSPLGAQEVVQALRLELPELYGVSLHVRG